MAERTKCRSQPPKRLSDEYVPVSDAKREKKMVKDNRFSEVEIVKIDKQEKKEGEEEVTLPFVQSEKMNIPVPKETSLEDRIQIFHERMYHKIKRKLWSGRRDDPDIRIEINVDADVFDGGLGQIVRGTQIRGRKVYSIEDNSNLDHLLGLKWNERVFNENGDFAYVVKGTVKYWLTKKNPIIEFKYMGGKFVQSEIEGLHILVFTFVRGDGNRRQYISGTF